MNCLEWFFTILENMGNMKNFSINISISILRHNVDISLLPFHWRRFRGLRTLRVGPVEVHFDHAAFYDLFSVEIAVDA